MEEKELIDRFKKGEEGVFFRFLDMYEKTVYTISLRIMGNSEDALDASQETWFKIYRNLKNFREESTLKTWIYRIAVNTSLTELKRKRRSNTLPLDEAVLKSLPVDYSELEEALLNLPEKYRVAVTLRDIYGYPYEEIKTLMHISLSSAKILVHRGRKKLKGKLEGYEFEEVEEWS